MKLLLFLSSYSWFSILLYIFISSSKLSPNPELLFLVIIVFVVIEFNVPNELLLKLFTPIVDVLELFLFLFIATNLSIFSFSFLSLLLINSNFVKLVILTNWSISK